MNRSEYSRSRGQRSPTEHDDSERPAFSLGEKEATIDLTIHVKDALKSWRFWHHSIMLFNGVFFGVYVAAVYKAVANTVIKDKYLTIAGSIGSFVNGSSRIFWASLLDKYGFKAIYMIMLFIQLVSSLFIYSARTNTFLYCVFVCLTFLCEGGHFSTFPAAAVKIYGIEEAGKIFTISFFAVPLSSLLGFALAQHKEYTGEQSIFLFGSFLTMVNIALLFIFDDGAMKVEYKDANGIVIAGHNSSLRGTSLRLVKQENLARYVRGYEDTYFRRLRARCFKKEDTLQKDKQSALSLDKSQNSNVYRDLSQDQNCFSDSRSEFSQQTASLHGLRQRYESSKRNELSVSSNTDRNNKFSSQNTMSEGRSAAGSFSTVIHREIGEAGEEEGDDSSHNISQSFRQDDSGAERGSLVTATRNPRRTEGAGEALSMRVPRLGG